MAKLHSYYISNTLKEMNYAFSDLEQDEFLNELNKSFNNITIELIKKKILNRIIVKFFWKAMK
jgi:hypothetical protein